MGCTQAKDGAPLKEIHIRLAQTHSVMTRLAVLWKLAICFPTKMKLYKSLGLSILFYGCESWTLTADVDRRIQAFKIKCYRSMLSISYKEHKTNVYVGQRQQVSILAGCQELLLSTVKRRTLSRFGHGCSRATLPNVIFPVTLDGSRR